MRTILVGDIHGCWDELRDLLDAVGLGADDHLISVGDLVDRGPAPSEVVDLFRTRPNSTALCGNHERKHVRGVFSYSQHVARLQMGARYAEDVAWFGTLPYHVETPEFRAVHFGHFPGVPLDEVPEDVRAGTTSGEAKLRERYGERPWWDFYDDDVPIVFGHAVIGEEPLIVRDRVYGLDTGACHGMRLTALVLPERRIVQVPARANHWVAVRDAWQVPVLRAHPWATTTFEGIAKKVRSLRDPELTGTFLDDVAAWADGVRGCLPALAERLDADLAAILDDVGADGFGRAASARPAGPWLTRHRAGKLSRDRLGCTTPADVFTLADALGVELPVTREP